MHIDSVKFEFDPEAQGDSPPLEAALLADMKPSRRGRLKLDAPKVGVKIRLDAGIVQHLRASRPRWQTRVNAALGELVTNGRI